MISKFEVLRPQADRLAGASRFRIPEVAVLDPRVEALQLTTFAERLARLAPCHRDPERFHSEKHALVGELRRAARELDLLACSQAALTASTRPAARGPIRLGLVRRDGRVVPVEARFRRSGKAE